MIGTTIGPYRVLRELGQGGMGTVVLAEDTRLGRHVALKTVSGAQAGTSGSRAQLLDEARAAAALTHPAIAAVHDVIEHDGNIAIVFELVEGETLAARLAKGPLPEPQAVAIAVQIADALAVAHGARVLHRDLKPSNIMLAPGGIVKILDFGIARFRPVGHSVPAGKDGDDAFMGTPGYVPPEQWTGRAVDERADLYALGVVLFEMLTGKRPFPEREPITLAFAAIDRIARRVSSLRPGVSPALDKLVARLLAADPALRPPRARVVADELRQLQAPPPPPVPPPWKTWLAVAVVALVAVGGGLWWWTRPVRLDVRNPVVAVMRLSNDTGDAANDYLAAGVADSLVTSLAALPTVTTLSRAMVEAARRQLSTPGDIARDLGATFVVDGAVQSAGDQLRFLVNLIRPDGSVAWSDAVEGRARDAFSMQARIVSAFGAALRVQMSAADLARLSTPPTSNANALDAYWRGRALLDRRDAPGNLPRAETAFKEALRLDPRFVDAHAALGETYWELYGTSRDQTWVDQAVQASSDAVRLAPDVAAVRLALGVTLTNGGRNAEAVQELQRVLALQPDNDEARRYLGRALAALGRLDEAVAEWRKALAARPNNWQALADLGRAMFESRRFAEAEAAYRQLIALRPDNVIGYQGLGSVFHRQDRTREALEYYERAMAITPAGQVLSNMGTLYHQQGDFLKAVDAYRRAIAARPNSAMTHRNLGDALSRLGRRDEARASYRRAVELAEAARTVNPTNALNLADLALFEAKAGDVTAARGRVQEAIRLAPEDVSVWTRAAQVHAVLGDTDNALDALGRALGLNYPPAEAASVDEFAPLRALPRYRELVAR